KPFQGCAKQTSILADGNGDSNGGLYALCESSRQTHLASFDGNCIALLDGSFVAATGNDLRAPANRTHEKIL
ncbi:hypothetical protein K0M31_016442, partial [Melipona bicolor]